MVTIEEAQASKELMGIFIEENMGLVGMTLKQLHLPPTDDHIQEGAIGLIKATKRFDTSRGVTFSTYAVPMIIGELKIYFRDYEYSNGLSGLKVSRELRKIYHESLKYEDYCDSEICKKLNITLEQLNDARTAMNTSKSLDEDVHHEDSGDAPISLHSIIPSSNNVEDEVTDRIFWEEFMNKAEAKFGAKAAKIARLYLDGMVQAEISKIVGISQAQVSRILKKIVNVYKQKEEGGIEMKITYDQLLSECREHGTGKEGQEIIAAKYGMTPGSVSVCIVRNGIVKKLKEEKKSISAQPEEQQISHANPDAQIIQVHKDPAPVTQSQSKHASTLKIKAWDGKENTYSFQDGKLVITNKEGVLPVVDINTMIAELQELADKKEAV